MPVGVWGFFISWESTETSTCSCTCRNYREVGLGIWPVFDSSCSLCSVFSFWQIWQIHIKLCSLHQRDKDQLGAGVATSHWANEWAQRIFHTDLQQIGLRCGCDGPDNFSLCCGKQCAMFARLHVSCPGFDRIYKFTVKTITCRQSIKCMYVKIINF